MRKKKAGLRSLQVLAAILLSRMGKKGARNLLAIVAIVVSFLISIFLSHTLKFIFFCSQCLAGFDKCSSIAILIL